VNICPANPVLLSQTLVRLPYLRNQCARTFVLLVVTPEERNLLADLASKIAQTPPPPRDPEAEDFIRKNIGSRPDALYLMTQTVLIQNMAIQQAQQQIRELQQQRPPQPSYPVPSGGSFLGQQQPQYPPQYPQQPQYAPPPASVMGQGSGPGFLRGAAQTAAGVAAGALAFEGIRELFSHSGSGSGFGGGQAGFMGGGGMPMEETVVNNYYDSPAPEGHHAEQLADTSDNQYTADDDDAQTQDADYDDSSSDDFSSSDDSSDIA